MEEARFDGKVAYYYYRNHFYHCPPSVRVGGRLELFLLKLFEKVDPKDVMQTETADKRASSYRKLRVAEAFDFHGGKSSVGEPKENHKMDSGYEILLSEVQLYVNFFKRR